MPDKNTNRSLPRTAALAIALLLIISLVVLWILGPFRPDDASDSTEEPANIEPLADETDHNPEDQVSELRLSPANGNLEDERKPSPAPTQIEATVENLPLNSPTAPPTLSPIPVSTPTIKLSPTPSKPIFVDNVDRTCPDPPPGKPDYQHYYLDATAWPRPAINPETHFWLVKPLEGGGRMLFTDWLPYGYDAGGRYLLHNGVDVAEPLGSPLLAAGNGTVVVAGSDEDRLYGWRCDWYGNLVVVELDDRWKGKPVYLVYGHVLNILVEPGQYVRTGDPLAEIGVGGAATRPHLHFEVRVGTNEFNSTRNPFLWLKPPGTRGIIVGRLVDPLGRPWQGVAVTAVGRSEGAENKTSWSYLGDPQNIINPDEELAENFVIPDLRPGQYELYLELQGQVYTLEVDVAGGQLSQAEIVTEEYKTPTPEPIDIPQDEEPVTPTPQD